MSRQAPDWRLTAAHWQGLGRLGSGAAIPNRVGRDHALNVESGVLRARGDSGHGGWGDFTGPPRAVKWRSAPVHGD